MLCPYIKEFVTGYLLVREKGHALLLTICQKFRGNFGWRRLKRMKDVLEYMKVKDKEL